jgi:hypothetical protein
MPGADQCQRLAPNYRVSMIRLQKRHLPVLAQCQHMVKVLGYALGKIHLYFRTSVVHCVHLATAAMKQSCRAEPINKTVLVNKAGWECSAVVKPKIVQKTYLGESIT